MFTFILLQVSWIKTKDLHILTSGKFTYTADSRMDVVYDPDAESWTLRIVRSRLTDVGKYECQVNTDPKMNKFFSLSIRETPLHDSPPISRADGSNIRATIAGPEEQYVKIGSTVTFECRLDYGTSRQGWEKSHARFSVRSIPNVQWLKDGLAVSFQAERGGISVETERGEKTGSSRLTLASVGSGDSGRYTCTGLGITPSTVTLNVIEGENHLEVMQRDDYNAMPSDSSSNLLQRSVLLIFGQKFSKLFLCNIFIIFAANYYLHYGIRYR